MAFVKCPECGNSVFDGAENCPKCTYPMKEIKKQHKRSYWFIWVVLAALIVAPFAPKFPLLFGIALLALSIAAFIPTFRSLSYNILRLKPEEKWRSGLCLVLYSIIGLILIVIGLAGRELNAKREAAVVEQAAKDAKARQQAAKVHAERRAREAKANTRVLSLVKEAQIAWERGNSILADETLNLASKVPNANNFVPVYTLRARMADAKSKALLADAINAANGGNIDRAKYKIQEALTVPHAHKLKEVTRFKQVLDQATSLHSINAILLSISDEAFLNLQTDGEMPKQLVSGYKGLDKYAAKLVNNRVAAVSSKREKLKQARAALKRRVEEEQKAKERAIAERMREAEKERKARELALAERKNKEEASKAFEQTLKTAKDYIERDKIIRSEITKRLEKLPGYRETKAELEVARQEIIKARKAADNKKLSEASDDYCLALNNINSMKNQIEDSVRGIALNCTAFFYKELNVTYHDAPGKAQVEVHDLVSGELTKTALTAHLEKRFEEFSHKTCFTYYKHPTHIFIYLYTTNVRYESGRGQWSAMLYKMEEGPKTIQVRDPSNKWDKMILMSDEELQRYIDKHNSTLPPSGPKSVPVKGYHRKDGTYVRPHNRHRPKRR